MKKNITFFYIAASVIFLLIILGSAFARLYQRRQAGLNGLGQFETAVSEALRQAYSPQEGWSRAKMDRLLNDLPRLRLLVLHEESKEVYAVFRGGNASFSIDSGGQRVFKYSPLWQAQNSFDWAYAPNSSAVQVDTVSDLIDARDILQTLKISLAFILALLALTLTVLAATGRTERERILKKAKPLDQEEGADIFMEDQTFAGQEPLDRESFISDELEEGGFMGDSGGAAASFSSSPIENGQSDEENQPFLYNFPEPPLLAGGLENAGEESADLLNLEQSGELSEGLSFLDSAEGEAEIFPDLSDLPDLSGLEASLDSKDGADFGFLGEPPQQETEKEGSVLENQPDLEFLANLPELGGEPALPAADNLIEEEGLDLDGFALPHDDFDTVALPDEEAKLDLDDFALPREEAVEDSGVLALEDVEGYLDQALAGAEEAGQDLLALCFSELERGNGHFWPIAKDYFVFNHGIEICRLKDSAAAFFPAVSLEEGNKIARNFQHFMQDEGFIAACGSSSRNSRHVAGRILLKEAAAALSRAKNSGKSLPAVAFRSDPAKFAALQQTKGPIDLA